MQKAWSNQSVLSNLLNWMLASPMGDGNGENDENGERESGDLVDENDLEEELSEKEGWVW